jgi:hypothetical protein
MSEPKKTDARLLAAPAGRVVRSKNLLLRKAALSASAASRHAFPAWIAADESGVAFPARIAMPRVRDGLVLRAVSKGKAANSRTPRHEPGAR